MTEVYALLDPRTYAARYIGRTRSGTRDRLVAHLSEARLHRAATPKSAWLLDLERNDLLPVVIVLEHVDDADAVHAERRHIAFALALGCPLTNRLVPVDRPPPTPTARGIHDASTAVDRDALVDALDRVRWNRRRAAMLLGIPRRTFYRRLREHGLLTAPPTPRAS